MAKGKTLFVSDFDDTLVKTDAVVYLKRDGKTISMTPEKYATYEEQPGDEFDFSEFNTLKNPKPIQRFVSLMKKAVLEGKADKVVVLTARGHTKPVADFLKSIGITKGVSIAALGDANPQRKANYIEKHIAQDGYTRVAFVDDSAKNIEAVKQLQQKFPKVKILAHQAKHAQEQPAADAKASVEVVPIFKGDENFKQADEWIRTKHYLKKWPKSVQQILGVRVNGKLAGVLVYGIGTRGQAATDIFGAGVMANNQLWELQRAFTTDEIKKEVDNLGSMVISKGNEYVRTKSRTKDGKPVKAIVSYADSAQGHGGSVYKSTNATYLGEQPPRTGWAITDPKTGDTVTRSTIKNSVLLKMAAEGYVIEKVTPDTGKHKFLYFLGKDQKERNELMAKMIKPMFSYPKEGQPPKEIPNPAKQQVKVKPQQQKKKDEPSSKVGIIKKILKTKVKNPETGNEILVQTALTYDKNHPSYRQAMGLINAMAKKHNIKIKQR
jgi:hypothetical protein